MLMAILLSCTTEVEKMVYFKNDSSKQVTYSIYQGSYSLLPSDSNNHQVPIELDVKPSFSVVMPMNVSMKKETHVKEDRYTFVDVDPIALHVLNNLSISVKISTGQIEYMDTPFITIAAISEDKGHYIYTKSPKFIIENSEGYPVDLESRYDTDTNTVYVTIR
jgi:hypothetical protein